MFSARGGHGWAPPSWCPQRYIRYINIYKYRCCVRRQQGLFDVLKAYSLFRPDEGYCQAQAPIAAVLLMHMPAEVNTHRPAVLSRSIDVVRIYHSLNVHIRRVSTLRVWTYGGWVAKCPIFVHLLHFVSFLWPRMPSGFWSRSVRSTCRVTTAQGW